MQYEKRRRKQFEYVKDCDASFNGIKIEFR